MRLFSFLLLFPVVLTAGPVEDLSAGSWYEVPNSHLYDVAPSGWSANVIGPWSSGAYDTKRDRYVIWVKFSAIGIYPLYSRLVAMRFS